jgi:hypothetical protein
LVFRLRLNTNKLRGKQGSPLGAGGFVVFSGFFFEPDKKTTKKKNPE